MAEAAIDLLHADLERVRAREWLREQGVSEGISPVDFVLHCLREEGVHADRQFADFLLWNCSGFPAFWHVGRHGDHPIECLSTQIRGWARVHRISPERAARIGNDPTYSFEDALAEIDEETRRRTEALLEDD